MVGSEPGRAARSKKEDATKKALFVCVYESLVERNPRKGLITVLTRLPRGAPSGASKAK